MNNDIKVLDCTLRDGGYPINSRFGEERIMGILEKLTNAGIDIIECGFLRNTEHTANETIYHLPKDIESYLPKQHKDTMYVAMFDAGKYDVSILSECNSGLLDGIRDCFHKEYREQAFKDASVLIEKGYKAFIQPTGILGYKEEEILELIDETNRIHPYAFSIVDTFGSMTKRELVRLVELISYRLDKDIYLGFHSHNNMQLAFPLSIEFIEMCQMKQRPAIVDGTLLGMGRGAGNTNTELLLHHMIDNFSSTYDIDTVLDVIDMYMKAYTVNQRWGYSIPYFIAGMYGVHVDNIHYLLSKGNLLTKDMRQIVSRMDNTSKKHFNPAVLSELCEKYMKDLGSICNSSDNEKLRELFEGKSVLVIAPGKSIQQERSTLNHFIESHKQVVRITINFIDMELGEIAFFGNKKRYDLWSNIDEEKFNATAKIVTSNISQTEDKNSYTVPFNNVIRTGWKHFAVSSVMLLRLLAQNNVSHIYIAGMDGYASEEKNGHYTELMNVYSSEEEKMLFDKETKEMLWDYKTEFGNKANLEFLTHSLYENIFE